MKRDPNQGKFCRRCRRTDSEVRFAPTSINRCLFCQADEKRERAERQKTLGRRAPLRRKRAKPGRCLAHLNWIRSLPCTVGARRCGSITHAHHVRVGSGGGTAKKPADEWAVPLCPFHHNEGHTVGWSTFEAKYHVNLREVAISWAALSPYLPRSRPTGLTCDPIQPLTASTTAP